jgi:hypothetical protein
LQKGLTYKIGRGIFGTHNNKRDKMERALKYITSEIYHIVNGERKIGAPSGISGNLTGIRGDLTGIRGDLTGISGNLSGISGDLTGIRGDLSDCKITEEERENGINIKDLINE